MPPTAPPSVVSRKRAAAKAPSLAQAFRAAYQRELAQRSDGPSPEASLWAAAHASRELLAERWIRTQAEDRADTRSRRVHYLSMEFLMGRALGNAVAALGLDDELRAAAQAAGHALPDVLEREADAALGNGGLGRLAACFLDSFADARACPRSATACATSTACSRSRSPAAARSRCPTTGCKRGNPWEIHRPELRWFVGFGGRVVADGSSQTGRRWLPAERIVATAFDFIVPGHGTERVATLRQWHALLGAADRLRRVLPRRAPGVGTRTPGRRHAELGALPRRQHAGRPRDAPEAGVPAGQSASLQDMLARHLREGRALHDFGRQNSVHLNDTHPALVPAELMRLLIDEQGLSWNEAWSVTREAVSYTNHTLMPEALETWAVPLFEALLPRHLEIVYEINRRFLEEVRAKFPGDEDRVRRMSLIDEHGDRRVRMAALSIVASHKVNGVSALHSRLMVQTIFADFAALYPDRFTNITNGVTPRRWLMQANPGLSALIDTQIGGDWRRDAAGLAMLARHAGKKALGNAFLKVKRNNKARLAALVRRELGVVIDPASLFDVQIKRIHEYKRQLLNLLHVVSRYQAIVADPNADWVPRTWSSPARQPRRTTPPSRSCNLIHDVARVVNSDPRVGDRLKVVFLPNYSVSLAEVILPAADLSEQISTAGTEASGTGNMKFALNGAHHDRHLGRRQHRDGASRWARTTCSSSACAPMPSRASRRSATTRACTSKRTASCAR